MQKNTIEISIEEYNQLKHDQEVLNKIRAYERKRIGRYKDIDMRVAPEEYQVIKDYADSAGISVRGLVLVALKEKFGIE